MRDVRKTLKDFRIQKVGYCVKGGTEERFYIQVKRFWWWEDLHENPPLLTSLNQARDYLFVYLTSGNVEYYYFDEISP